MNSKRLSTLFLIILYLLQFSGCWKRQTVTIVCIVDLTGSVEAEAKASVFVALKEMFKKLRRGDTLIIIPLTGDALTQTQGKVLRFSLSEKREVYDEDLDRLAEEAKNKLEALEAEAKANAYKQTDIFGSLEIAQEILNSDKTLHKDAEHRRILILFSDMLQDDAQCVFMRDTRFANEESAQKYAAQKTLGKENAWRNTRIYMGIIRSTDLAKINHQRREAVRTFWMDFFKQGNAENVVTATDGTGQLEQFLKESGL